MPIYTVAADPNFHMPTTYGGRSLAIDPSGVLWAVYTKEVGTTGRIYAAHSSNNGLTWTPEEVSVDVLKHQDPVIAIDSTGILYVCYTAFGRAPHATSHGIFCKQRSVAGVWSAEETVSLQATITYSPSCAIAIDSNDDVNCVISTRGYGANPGQWNIIYRKRTAGVWGAVVQITDIASAQGIPSLAVDSSDVVQLAWYGRGWGLNPTRKLMVYCCSPIWAVEVVDDGPTRADMTGSIAVDSSNNPYVSWCDWDDDNAYYSVKLLGAWGARQRIDDCDDVARFNVSMAIDKNDDLHFVYSGFPFGPPWLVENIHYRSRLGGVWESQVQLTSEAADSQYYPVILWATWPQIAGVRTNILQGRHAFIWKSMGSAILFFISSIVTVPVNKAYALAREEL